MTDPSRSPTRSPLLGQRLGRYQIEASLGRGGMAEVFRAIDSTLGRTVAVKVIQPAFAADPQFVERFLREARLVAALEHPHILPVYDVGEAAGVPFLVMPLLAGGSLAERLAGQPFSLQQVVTWIQQLAEALDFAHQRGVLHRDVKPANVLVAEVAAGGSAVGVVERLVLADFGIAKVTDSATRLTATGAVVGTPVYMAPELAQGKASSPASDRYSLAVVAYELLTGAPPFRGENALSLMHQHVSGVVPAVAERVAGLPPLTDRLFAAALSKDPADRPPTARALADALAWLATFDQPTAALDVPVVPVAAATGAGGASGALGSGRQASLPTELERPWFALPSEERAALADAGLRMGRAMGVTRPNTGQPTLLRSGPKPETPSGRLDTTAQLAPTEAQPTFEGDARAATPMRRPAAYRWLAGAALVVLVVLAGAWWRSRPKTLAPTPDGTSTEVAAAAPTEVASGAADQNQALQPTSSSVEPAADLNDGAAVVSAAGDSADVGAAEPLAPVSEARPPSSTNNVAIPDQVAVGAGSTLTEPRRGSGGPPSTSSREALLRLRSYRERPSRASYEAALAALDGGVGEAGHVDLVVPMQALAEAGLAWIDGNAAAARRALATVTESELAPTLPGMLPLGIWTAVQAQAPTATLPDWTVAVAVGDPLAHAAAGLVRASVAADEQPAGWMARAVLARLDGNHLEASRLGEKVVKEDLSPELEAGVAGFVSEELAFLGQRREALVWAERAVATAPGDRARGLYAFHAARLARELRQPDDVRRLLALACESGIAVACPGGESAGAGRGQTGPRRPKLRPRPPG